MKSKTAFDEGNTYLGRVDTLSVAPPCTVASLKSRIVKVEGIVDREIQMFEDTDGEALMKDADRASFLSETFPGCLEDDPLALVFAPKTLGQGSIMTRPIRTNSSCGEYNRQKLARRIHMLVIQAPNAQSISTWHAFDIGEILHTDGVKATKPYFSTDGSISGILLSRFLFFLVISLLSRPLSRLHGNKLCWKTGV